MNAWTYLDANPVGALVLLVVLGWTLARVIRAWRDRRPVTVRIVAVCPECQFERDGEVQR